MLKWLLRVTMPREVWEYQQWKKRELFVKYKIKKENKKRSQCFKTQ